MLELADICKFSPRKDIAWKLTGGTKVIRYVWDELYIFNVPISAFWLQDSFHLSNDLIYATSGPSASIFTEPVLKGEADHGRKGKGLVQDRENLKHQLDENNSEI
ncbi:hypothetical protein ACFE04_004810 [Oxalis oulophora]